jgi:hypothetical protein
MSRLKNESFYSFPLYQQHISNMHGGILMKLHKNVHHYKKLSRADKPGR